MEIKEKKEMQYEIIGAATSSDLVKRIREFIKEGWYPLGGIVVSGKLFYQAIAKRN